jgi:hypothetical protein
MRPTLLHPPGRCPARNLAVFTIDDLAAIIKNRLRSIQRRPSLIPGFLAQTGLTLEPGPSP